MHRIRLAIIGWSIFFVGLLLFVRQLSAGGQPDWLFNLSVGLLIGGTVLRVYAGYRPRTRKSAARPESPDVSVQPPANPDIPKS